MPKLLSESEILEVVKTEFETSILPYQISIVIDEADLTTEQKEWAMENIELTIKLKY